MRVISIGTDRKIFEKNSAILARTIDYASKTEELHMIVFSIKKLGLKPYSIGNVHIYPTNSVTRFHYVLDAYHIGINLIKNCKLKIKNCNNFVISCQDPFETGFVGYKLSKKFNLALQLQIHTDFLSAYFKNSILNRIRVVIAKFIIPKARGLRVVSEVIASSIKRQFPNLKVNPEVLPIFVDIHKIINAEPLRNIMVDFPQFKFTIIMASRLTVEKRIDIALKAFKKVVDKFPHTGLVIAGDGDQKKNLENLSKKLGLSGNVVFVGWQNDLVSYYKTANLYLLTSEFEGYGMSLVEAGACGCPIVTTAVGIAKSNPFMSGKNCIVCPVNNIQCIADAIIELIQDNAKRELFKLEISNSIKNMIITKEEYVNRYVSLLKDLLKN